MAGYVYFKEGPIKTKGRVREQGKHSTESDRCAQVPQTGN